MAVVCYCSGYEEIHSAQTWPAKVSLHTQLCCLKLCAICLILHYISCLFRIRRKGGSLWNEPGIIFLTPNNEKKTWFDTVSFKWFRWGLAITARVQQVQIRPVNRDKHRGFSIIHEEPPWTSGRIWLYLSRNVQFRSGFFNPTALGSPLFFFCS